MSMVAKTFAATDGTVWGVSIRGLSSSNSMVVFRHPDGESSRLDRYNWVINQGPESRSVTARQTEDGVLDQLNDASLKRLFARSMPISTGDSLLRGPDVER
ncbi:MAG: hypothetical protein M3Z05_09935 [Gemmatimonadota bacterium]|nr:hypothetical protein [Gemmatimonadota bacterium]